MIFRASIGCDTLQLCDCLSSIRKLYSRDSGHGKKRLRSTETHCSQEQHDERVDDDANLPTRMQSLLCLLKKLNQSLQKSAGTGTPAIHMYSILDQIAALHDELYQRELGRDGLGLHAIDAELICVLKLCKDDEKRKRVRPKADGFVNETPFWLIAFSFCF